MSSWHVQPVFGSLLLVAAVALALGSLLLIRPAFRSLSRRRLAALAAIRLAVIGLLTLALLRPTLVSTTRKPQTGVLLLLYDQSRSMQLPQGSSQQSRWEAQQEALRQAEAVLRQLDDRLELRVYGYDVSLHASGWKDERLELPPAADGPQTDIGSNLHEAIQREAGQRVAAVVLLGDGAQTAFQPRYEIQEAARELDRLGCPLFAVPFGPATDEVQARDVAVENLLDQYTVFVKNELPLRATIRARGFANQPIPVVLTIEPPDGAALRQGPLEVRTRSDSEEATVEFRLVPQQPGRYKLTVEAAEQPGELVTKNNRMGAFLRVLEGGLRLLYLEGELRWEQRFLRRALDASADIEVDFLWVDPAQRDRWPIDLDEVWNGPPYDVFLLGDLDATALGQKNLTALAERINRGAGLAALGGYHSFGAGGYRETALADVLPLEMDRFERQDFDAPIRDDLHREGPLQMVPLSDHPILHLSDDDNDAAWKTLVPLSGANRIAGVKQSAGVRVLAESQRGEPLLVIGEYGNGRVAALAGDSTWRWVMHGQGAAFDRFWRQMVLWLARREESRQDDVWVKLDRRRVQLGGNVPFTAGANTAAGRPVADAELRAELVAPDGSRQELRIGRQAERWEGVVEGPAAPGDYAIEVRAERGGESIGAGSAEFLVFDRDVELTRTAADHDQLARLALGTAGAGGRLVPPELLADLLASLRDRPPELSREIQSQWQLGDTGRDAWLFLVAFALLLGGDWLLRKRWGLV